MMLLAASAVAATDGWHASSAHVRHSDVALMPEGTPDDYAAFAPVRPSLVVWGEDGLPALDGGAAAAAKLRQHTEAYRALGIREIAANVWMLTATERYLFAHPELGDTSCVDLWGQRIVPRWLSDADDHGTKAWWGCTNQPRYQAHLFARLRAGLSAGATMVHLDDHSGTYACAAGAGGCFCAECMRGFRTWLRAHVPVDQLAQAGVTTPETFDYRAFLQARHYRDREGFIRAAASGHVPLWTWFLAYQREAALHFVARLRSEASAVLGHDVAVGVNAYNLDPKQLFDASEIDYFANEVEHWDKEDLIAPLAYRLGEALGRPTFVTGSGDDWIAYRRAGATQRVRGWIAQAYAFGQYFMYAWNKWGYSDATGTLWTQVPTSVYAPFCAFVRDHATLFDDFENAATVGLLYDNASANHGKWQVRNASKALLDAGVPYRVIVRGDDVLRFPLAEPTGSLRALVVPSDVEHTAALDAWLDRRRRAGTNVVVSGAGTVTPIVTVRASGRVWALPRRRTATAKSAGVTSTDAPTTVIHLLNRDYDASADAFRSQRNIVVSMDPAIFGASPPRTARYYAPGRETVTLEIKAVAGHYEVVVPELEIWGIIAAGAAVRTAGCAQQNPGEPTRTARR